MRRTKTEAARAKRIAVKQAEDAGLVADDMETRRALMARVHNGEITLAEAQAELKRIKRNATKNGLTTRNRVYRNS